MGRAKAMATAQSMNRGVNSVRGNDLLPLTNALVITYVNNFFFFIKIEWSGDCWPPQKKKKKKITCM